MRTVATPVYRTVRYSRAVDEDENRLIDYTEMAERAGVTPATMRSYRNKNPGRRGTPLPEPDAEPVPGHPRWKVSTFETWMASRPIATTRTGRRRDA